MFRLMSVISLLFFINIFLFAYFNLNSTTFHTSTNQNVAKLILLHEVTSEQENSLKSTHSLPSFNLVDDFADRVISSGRCALVGPYADTFEVTRTITTLKQQGIKQVAIAKHRVLKGNKILLYIKQNNIRIAQEIRQDLLKRKIDSNIIDSGELAGNIALALFFDMDSVTQYQKKLWRKQGMIAQTHITPHYKHSFYIALPTKHLPSHIPASQMDDKICRTLNSALQKTDV